VDTAQIVLGGGAPPSGSGIYSATPSSISINNNPPQNYYYATAFTINNADTIRAIDFMFGGDSIAQNMLYHVELWKYDEINKKWGEISSVTPAPLFADSTYKWNY